MYCIYAVYVYSDTVQKVNEGIPSKICKKEPTKLVLPSPKSSTYGGAEI